MRFANARFQSGKSRDHLGMFREQLGKFREHSGTSREHSGAAGSQRRFAPLGDALIDSVYGEMPRGPSEKAEAEPEPEVVSESGDGVGGEGAFGPRMSQGIAETEVPGRHISLKTFSK